MLFIRFPALVIIDMLAKPNSTSNPVEINMKITAKTTQKRKMALTIHDVETGHNFDFQNVEN